MNEAAGITFESAGAGAQPLICLHGLGGDAESFRPQIDGLSRERRVISWNMPGYGGSAPPDEWSFAALSQALGRLMDALGADRAHLAGQSVGGMVALDFAIRWPARVASLALIATTSAFGGRDDTFKQEFLAARLAPLDRGQSMADLAQTFVPEIVGPTATPETVASATRSMASVPESTYRAMMRCLVTFNRRDEIAGVDVPCCLIAGSHDTNSPAKTMARMAEKMPNADYHLIEGAGHLVNLERRAETNALLEAFYQKIGAAR